MAKALLLILALLIAAAAIAALFFVGSKDVVVPENGAGILLQCEEDAKAAQDASLDKICTAQFAELRCPHDDTFVYNAPNGCEISFLNGKGWTQAN